MGLEQIQVELQDWMGSDESVAHAAWTSSMSKKVKEKKTKEQVEELCQRIVRDGHRVPVESVVFRFWIRLPIFADRQHQTHRIQSASGLSGRYRTMPEDYYELPHDVEKILEKLDAHGVDIAEAYDFNCAQANEDYRKALKTLKIFEESGHITNTEYKRVREILRGQLPQAGMTERVTVINLGSLANYQLLRNSGHAQPEIRYIAKLMLREIEKEHVAPITIKALKAQGFEISPGADLDEIAKDAKEMLL